MCRRSFRFNLQQRKSTALYGRYPYKLVNQLVKKKKTRRRKENAQIKKHSNVFDIRIHCESAHTHRSSRNTQSSDAEKGPRNIHTQYTVRAGQWLLDRSLNNKNQCKVKDKRDIQILRIKIKRNRKSEYLNIVLCVKIGNNFFKN